MDHHYYRLCAVIVMCCVILSTSSSPRQCQSSKLGGSVMASFCWLISQNCSTCDNHTSSTATTPYRVDADNKHADDEDDVKDHDDIVDAIRLVGGGRDDVDV